ncbi:N-acetylmuramoyl-L-alanine amidase [Rhodoplanes sp. TEM]|uniref:N-acetylmuramoyl-L-alanine amidase n=1 Tax=Rhodoplanes tepidamans TaxID=200616 RepID=A0ABT5JJM5_RHOTP|nr:N-acetylmuramoyl-L-alanine amidase [Rhodoplanes tepidamans]MDC7986114.1 N-acetylmuramoyl-L-alanine amidase [Rhodoplanes sp. TEM]
MTFLVCGIWLSVCPSAVSAADCRPENFRVLLDVGHTVDQPGATSARGVTEHVFNLRLAKRIEERLRDGGFVRTALLVIPRGTGRRQLDARVRAANRRPPDLVLSIHHDDVQPQFHAQWVVDGRTRDYSDRFAGWSLFVSRENRRYDASLAFAQALGAALLAKGLPFTRHHAAPIPGEGRPVLDDARGVFGYDGLVVLKGADAPAVLFEAGVIVNRAEEIALAGRERQDAIAGAVLTAVQAFCELQAGR